MSSDVTGNNTYNNFTAGGSTHLTLESGSIQTAANFVLGGDCGDYLIMDASVSGNEATLSKTSGVVDSRFLNLTDIHTTGGANFNATFQSTMPIIPVGILLTCLLLVLRYHLQIQPALHPTMDPLQPLSQGSESVYLSLEQPGYHSNHQQFISWYLYSNGYR